MSVFHTHTTWLCWRIICLFVWQIYMSASIVCLHNMSVCMQTHTTWQHVCLLCIYMQHPPLYCGGHTTCPFVLQMDIPCLFVLQTDTSLFYGDLIHLFACIISSYITSACMQIHRRCLMTAVSLYNLFVCRYIQTRRSCLFVLLTQTACLFQLHLHANCLYCIRHACLWCRLPQSVSLCWRITNMAIHLEDSHTSPFGLKTHTMYLVFHTTCLCWRLV